VITKNYKSKVISSPLINKILSPINDSKKRPSMLISPILHPINPMETKAHTESFRRSDKIMTEFIGKNNFIIFREKIIGVQY